MKLNSASWLTLFQLIPAVWGDLDQSRMEPSAKGAGGDPKFPQGETQEPPTVSVVISTAEPKLLARGANANLGHAPSPHRLRQQRQHPYALVLPFRN